MEYLVSGLIGALIASFLSGFFMYIRETINYRRDLAIRVVEWADDMYHRVGNLQVHRFNVYTHKKPLYSDTEYQIASRDLSRILTESKEIAMVNIAYGDGSETQMMNELQETLLEIYRKIINSSKSSWEETNNEIMNKFKDIEKVRILIHKRFISGVKVASIICDLIKYFIPTFWVWGLSLRKILSR